MYIYYVIVFFAFLLLYSIIGKKWGISTFLIAVYLITLLVALLITNIFRFYTESKEASIVFSTALFLFFLPYLRRAPTIKPLTNSATIKKAVSSGYFVSCVLLFLSVLILPAIVQSFRVGANDIRMGYYTYHGNFITATAIHFIDIISPISYSLLTLSFYMFSFFDGYNKEKKIIFIASLAAPYYGILSGGRTQMIYWLLSLIFNYMLFRSYLPKQGKKQLIKFVSVVFVFIFIYFIRSTIDRFANSSLGTNDSLLLYMGQPYLNFCYFYEDFHRTASITLSRIFPLTDSIFNGVFDLQAYRDAMYSASGMDIGVFYTLLGDLFVDIGLNGMYIYAFIYMVLAFTVTRKKQIYLSDVLILGLLYLIPLQGVFYYSFWKRQVTFCALIVLIFTFFIKEKKTIE